MPRNLSCMIDTGAVALVVLFTGIDVSGFQADLGSMMMTTCSNHRGTMRSHWSVGNRPQCVSAMAFRAGESCFRTGQAAHNLSIRRRLDLKLLRS